MIRLLKVILSFFVVFSIIDLSAINLLNNIVCNQKNNIVTVADMIDIQYDVVVKTKTIVKTFCDSLAMDVEFILTNRKKQTSRISLEYNLFSLNIDGCFSFVKCIINVYKKNVFMVNKYNEYLLFFFGFIFIFMLRYLGLLSVFDAIKKIYINMKAYSL